MNRSRPNTDAPELHALRRRLDGTRGPEFWRSLEELSDEEQFLQYLHREFPEQASEWHDPVGRRQFLRVMAASLALAGVSGCVVRPEEKIVPYVVQPEQMVPGKPLYFATAAPLGGYGIGLLVESHQGRPTKVEGNPDHPASLGATDTFAQAEVLNLYDPDRGQGVTRNARYSTWNDFLNDMIGRREGLAAKAGAGLAILTGTVTSPTLTRLIRQLMESENYGQVRWYQHDPIGQQNSTAGARLALGEPAEAVCDFTQADVLVSLDADFLHWGPGRLRYARDFISRREPADDSAAHAFYSQGEGEGEGGHDAINRLYVAEVTPTITGAMADERIPIRPSEVPAAALALARALGVEGLPTGPATSADAAWAEWVRLAAEDLNAHKGHSLVLVGEGQPPEVHALGHAINRALENVGKTIRYVAPIAAQAPEGRGGTLADLAAEIEAGRVDLVINLGVNAVYNAPADLPFGEIMTQNRRRTTFAYLGLYVDETARKSQWYLPAAHFLETWGDVRAFDGTVTIQQPLIAPIYSGVSALSVIAALVEGVERPALDLIRETWRGDRDDLAFEEFWQATLHKGVVADSAAETVEVAGQAIAGLNLPAGASAGGDAYELVIRPDPTIWDGQYANNGWLQELPKPLTRLTWDNAAMLSPATAEALGLEDEQVVELNYQGRALSVPVHRLPGQPDGVVTLHLGLGRGEAAGRVADGAGFNAYLLRTSAAPWGGAGLEAPTATGARYPLASVQRHHNMAGRDLVRSGTLAEILGGGHGDDHHGGDEGHDTEGGHHGHHEPPAGLTIFEHPEPMRRRDPATSGGSGFGNAWGMAINLNACIGCNACVVACQAENNIPVVGKKQVLAGREMHWLRIDRYYQTTATKEDSAYTQAFSAAAANPKTYFQPVPCMHCENAPCEIVCPVAATTHSPEGLNEMTYNRCVGTRYCSNNCPYKVRRFNFFNYPRTWFGDDPVKRMQTNPDVSVRFRGIMEKCTYCVQRINNARIYSEIAGEERVPGNAVQTACQQSCPTRAIVFGNLNDPAADVVKLKASPRNYTLLAELNARPRTTYLARLINPKTATAHKAE